MHWIRQSGRLHLVIEVESQMPIHDWSKVKPGTYHNFLQLWTSSITWVEPIAVGSPLPIMPLFLRNAFFINVPLETSYQQTWDVLPIELKRTIATPSSGG
jgi:hypothetical protein